MTTVQPADFANYAFASNVLDQTAAGRLIALCDSQGQEGTIAHTTLAPAIRRSNVAWVPRNADYNGLYDLVWNLGKGFNARYFGFELNGFDSAMQVARYDATREGGYDWHIDFGLNAQARKLSLSIQLSPPDGYAGGDLEFDLGAGKVPAGRELGLAIAFPSFLRHRVAPVTHGVRYSLVAWLSGPRFR